MTDRGRYIPGKQREAAFASMLLPETERNELRARKALAEKVLSRFDIHHVKYFSWGGSNRWWNLDPQLKADHKRRTKTDIGIIAKSKRIQKKEYEHKWAAFMKWHEAGSPAPTDGHGNLLMPMKLKRKRKIPSRPLRSRKFPRGKK